MLNSNSLVLLHGNVCSAHEFSASRHVATGYAPKDKCDLCGFSMG